MLNLCRMGVYLVLMQKSTYFTNGTDFKWALEKSNAYKMLREILLQLFSLFSGFYCVFMVDGGSDIGLFTMSLSVNYILSSFVYFFTSDCHFRRVQSGSEG